MGFRVETFKADDVMGLDSEQELDYAIALNADPKTSFTGWIDDKVLFCAGVAAYWKGRGEAWAFFNRDLIKPHVFKVVRSFRRYLDICPYERIEAAAIMGNKEYNNFLEAVGFKMYAFNVRKYLPDGSTVNLYEMVKD